jgi:hypothetical protein
LFGGVGAILGGLSNRNKIQEIELQLSVKSFHEPIIPIYVFKTLGRKGVNKNLVKTQQANLDNLLASIKYLQDKKTIEGIR